MTADDVRSRAIEAGARALARDENWASMPRTADWNRAAAVVDAVTPIIRADERATVWGETFLPEVHLARIEAEVRERIAQEIEDAMTHGRYGGAEHNSGLTDAARIARGGTP